MARFEAFRGTSMRGGFTLIELLTVMVLIAILAAIVLGTAGYVQRKGARARTEAEIKSMETAAETYRSDNGAFPRSADTDALDPRVDKVSTGKYQASTRFLYGEISKYMHFDATQVVRTQPDRVDYIVDPFGSSFGYSTARLKWIEDGAKAGQEKGYNATFDLWSTTGSPDPAKWIRNW